MKNLRRVVLGVLGGLGSIWFGLVPAYAGMISPTDPATLKVNLAAPVTVSLYQLDSTLPATVPLSSPSRCTTTGTAFYRDVTDCWLPEWNPTAGGKSVYVVVNGSTSAPVLTAPAAAPAFPLADGTLNPFVAALTTSAYPGQCVNFGSGGEADFLLLPPAVTLATSANTSVVGYELKPTDCGGMAVVQVNGLKFILPRDGTDVDAADGIPDVWANLHGGIMTPWTDIDTGPLASSQCCDGISNFDEWRGFIVSGTQVRGNPNLKDVFVHLMNPLCGTTSLLGGGGTTYPTTGDSLFANAHALVPPERFHLLGYTSGANGTTDEWVDNFVSLTPPLTLSVSDPISDRVVNRNRLYGAAQKGLRVMECLDVSTSSPVGWAFGVGSPNEVGNVILYTQRIVNYITNSLIGFSTLKYSTASLVNGVWTWATPGLVLGTGSATDPAVKNFVISKAMIFYNGMEVGHSLDLTPAVQGTNKVSYGFHFAPGTGDCLDQAITTASRSGTVTFYIPSICGNVDHAEFHIH